MIAFDVFLNRKKLARAGVGSDGVLTAITTWVRRRTSRTDRKRSQRDSDLSFSLGGYRSTNGDIGEHFKWEDRKLEPGDVLTIKVITAERVERAKTSCCGGPKIGRAVAKTLLPVLETKVRETKDEMNFSIGAALFDPR